MTKEKINIKLDKLITLKILASSIYDGYVCKKCNVTQGEEKKGIKKWYKKILL